MAYIIKNTSGLVNTRVTDTGRQKLSEGNFRVAYFAVGDSEVSYNTLPDTYNQSNTVVLEPQFNAQNSSGILYIKDNKSAEFLETIGLIILAKINHEETSLIEDSTKLSLTQCVEELKDMRLVEQPHPTSVVPLLQNLSNILSL